MSAKKGQRYDVSGLAEGRFEPGSRGRVLANLLGIKKKREMDEIEAAALAQAMDALIHEYDRDHRFTAHDICEFHRLWLGEIYEWAGRYRQVNIGKGGFQFAAADQVPRLMGVFESDVLGRHTPCTFGDRSEVVAALAETHVELMLIHPFREGNGRVGRVLATLMALQAGLPLLDFSHIKGKKKEEYFAAVRAGLDRNYQPMEKVFSQVIEQSLSAS